MEANKVERFEKGFLFGFVRWASLFLGVVGVIAVLFGAFFFFDAWTSLRDAKLAKIKPSEVKELVEKQKIEEAKAKERQKHYENNSSQQPPPSKPELVGKEKEVDLIVTEITSLIVESFENPAPDAHERIKNILMSEVRKYFENNDADNKRALKWLSSLKETILTAPKAERPQYTDTFTRLFNERQQKENQKAAEKRSNAQMKMGLTVYVISVGLILAFLSGLVLIMVAIERNTRPTSA